MKLIWFAYFIATAILTVQASEQTCNKERANQLVELAKNVYNQLPISETTFTVPETADDLRDSLEQILNRGIANSETYYKIKKRKLAVTCSVKQHSTTVMILQLAEANCEKSAALADDEQRQSCEAKDEGKMIDCVWSGEISTPPLTYGFWCAETTGVCPPNIQS
ncbi:hypothetical protein D918_03214 [Trichuris suis]|nr:hypothetical protein D918_03214 [Trichuris suis]